MATTTTVRIEATAAQQIASRARFREASILGELVRAQGCRCPGCGQVLELGSVVLTLISFPSVALPAAAHAECRDGLGVVGDWDGLAEVLQAQIGGETPTTGAIHALARVYGHYRGDQPVGEWPD